MRKYFMVAVMVYATTVNAQITKADYARAVSFLWPNVNNKTYFSIQHAWFQDSTGVSYTLRSKDTASYYKLKWNGKPEPLFDHQQLAKSLSAELNKEVKPTDLPITNLKVLNGNKMEFTSGNKTYILTLPDYALTVKTAEPPRNQMEQASPNGEWIAYTDNYNLFIRNSKTGEKKQLSTAGYKNFEYGTAYGWSDIIEGENGERPKQFRVQWSPDSKWIQTYICDLRSGNKMYMLDWSVDTLYRPKLLSYYRASPGDTGMVYMTPVFFNIGSGEEYRRDVARATHTFPVSYQWTKKPGIAIEQIMKRGFQQVVVNELDVINKKERLLYSETSKTNIDAFTTQWVEEWNKLLVLSDRSGWRQIYTVDAKDGTLKALTNGEYYINNWTRIDRKNRQIYFNAQGKETGRIPYLWHHYRIDADGKGLTLLTPENAHHSIFSDFFSPDGRYIIDYMSAHSQPTVSVLRSSADGKIVHTIGRDNIEGLKKIGYQFPEVFSTIGRDGKTTIYGTVWKPSNFDSTQKYPIIDDSYTGPHTYVFPSSFTNALGRGNQALAELGFIVVAIDGMGTTGRSKAFQAVSYKNMGQNLLDHVIAIRQLGRRYKWVDTTRVGIFGHSAGGYDAARAVLAYPEMYKVAVASSADHDFRMEKDWWPEMYMGWPVDSTYHLVSNITNAPNLKGKLLITHGGIDENVNPSATFKLAEALIKADKPFDMFIFPSQRHGYSGPYGLYFLKKRWNYFVEHLRGEKPIWEVPMK